MGDDVLPKRLQILRGVGAERLLVRAGGKVLQDVKGQIL